MVFFLLFVFKLFLSCHHTKRIVLVSLSPNETIEQHGFVIIMLPDCWICYQTFQNEYKFSNKAQNLIHQFILQKFVFTSKCDENYVYYNNKINVIECHSFSFQFFFCYTIDHPPNEIIHKIKLKKEIIACHSRCFSLFSFFKKKLSTSNDIRSFAHSSKFSLKI